MKSFVLLLLALLPLCNYGQIRQPAQASANTAASQQVSAAYIQRAVAFIRQVKSGKLINPEFILIDSSGTLNSNKCLQYVLDDKQFYSAAELELIESRAASWRCQWTNTDFPGIRIVKQDTVRAAFKKGVWGWDYYYKHIGRDYNEFSMPIFFRNNTCCLFYSANYCGDLCAEGSIKLFRKEKNSWKLVKAYCEWVS